MSDNEKSPLNSNLSIRVSKQMKDNLLGYYGDGFADVVREKLKELIASKEQFKPFLACSNCKIKQKSLNHLLPFGMHLEDTDLLFITFICPKCVHKILNTPKELLNQRENYFKDWIEEVNKVDDKYPNLFIDWYKDIQKEYPSEIEWLMEWHKLHPEDCFCDYEEEEGKEKRGFFIIKRQSHLDLIDYKYSAVYVGL